MTASRILRWTAALVISVAALLGAAVAWLFVTEPQPRQAEGWTLREPLPWPRGELATAVAQIAPCPDAPCPELERLFVLGGLSGLGTVEGGVTGDTDTTAPTTDETTESGSGTTEGTAN